MDYLLKSHIQWIIIIDCPLTVQPIDLQKNKMEQKKQRNQQALVQNLVSYKSHS